MRKEVVLAIIIGIILGAIILYGIKIADQSVTDNQATDSAQTKNNSTITPVPTPANTVIITSPTDHFVSFTTPITLKGQTKPQTVVAITADSDENIVKSDDQGNFSSSINLIGGQNTITATSIFPDNSTSSASISIIYTTSQIDN